MSGVEVAGVVLGAVPLLASATEHYRNGAARVFKKNYRNTGTRIRDTGAPGISPQTNVDDQALGSPKDYQPNGEGGSEQVQPLSLHHPGPQTTYFSNSDDIEGGKSPSPPTFASYSTGQQGHASPMLSRPPPGNSTLSLTDSYLSHLFTGASETRQASTSSEDTFRTPAAEGEHQITMADYANGNDQRAPRPSARSEQPLGRLFNMSWMDSADNFERRETWVAGTLNGILVSAFPDSCSALNIISRDFARRNNIPIQKGDTKTINLPTGSAISSIGIVTLAFAFDGEDYLHNVVFSIFPRCIHDIVLGSGFLYITETFTTYSNRIQRSLSSHIRSIPRVCLTGVHSQVLTCTINGFPVSAAPDSGSETMVIRKDFAQELGLDIDRRQVTLTTLEFLDGSLQGTCGVTHNVRLKFGYQYTRGDHQHDGGNPSTAPKLIINSPEEWREGTDASAQDTYLCTFHVVDNLICDVILSADLLYGTNAFQACSEYFQYGTAAFPMRPSAFAIRKTKHNRDLFSRLRAKCVSKEGSSSAHANLSEYDKEIIRRDTTERCIENLPEQQRPAAWLVEDEIRRQWDVQRVNQARVTATASAP